MTNPRIGLLYRQTDAAMPLLDLADADLEARPHGHFRRRGPVGVRAEVGVHGLRVLLAAV